MKKIPLRTKITLTIVGLLALTGIFYAASPTQFATVGDPNVGNVPIGLAASLTKLLVTEYTTQNIDSIDNNGTVSLFGTIPNFQGNAEKYIAIAPGFGQWDPDYVYVTQGADIYKFAPDGTTSATPFVTLQDNQGHGCGFDETGITFDQEGTFGYDMILTCVTGDVWRVNPAGTPTWVTNTGTGLEGPAVAPQNFGPYGGQVWAGDEDNGLVYAIGSDGIVHNVVTWQGAEGVLVVPSNPCAFADSNGILFLANQSDVYKFSQNDPDLTSAAGNLLVTSETGAGIGVITTDGTNYNVALFDNSVAGAEYEGAAFVQCQTGAPTPTPTPTATGTSTPAPTPTATATAIATATATATTTATATATFTPTATSTAAATATATVTSTPTVSPTPMPAGKVTGGGEITVTGGWANYGFNAQNGPSGPKGQLEYQNHARNLNVHTVSITSVNVSSNNASFSGTCTKNGAPCTFTVNTQDNGEPGTSDRFTIAVSGEPMEGGQISNGNIQIHN